MTTKLVLKGNQVEVLIQKDKSSKPKNLTPNPKLVKGIPYHAQKRAQERAQFEPARNAARKKRLDMMNQLKGERIYGRMRGDIDNYKHSVSLNSLHHSHVSRVHPIPKSSSAVPLTEQHHLPCLETKDLQCNESDKQVQTNLSAKSANTSPSVKSDGKSVDDSVIKKNALISVKIPTGTQDLADFLQNETQTHSNSINRPTPIKNIYAITSQNLQSLDDECIEIHATSQPKSQISDRIVHKAWKPYHSKLDQKVESLASIRQPENEHTFFTSSDACLSIDQWSSDYNNKRFRNITHGIQLNPFSPWIKQDIEPVEDRNINVSNLYAIPSPNSRPSTQYKGKKRKSKSKHRRSRPKTASPSRTEHSLKSQEKSKCVSEADLNKPDLNNDLSKPNGIEKNKKGVKSKKSKAKPCKLSKLSKKRPQSAPSKSSRSFNLPASGHKLKGKQPNILMGELPLDQSTRIALTKKRDSS